MATITPADALAHFKGKGITVQTARPIQVKGEDGKTREAFETAKAALAAEHILNARDYGDRVAITTIDGRRHEVAKSGKAADK